MELLYISVLAALLTLAQTAILWALLIVYRKISRHLPAKEQKDAIRELVSQAETRLQEVSGLAVGEAQAAANRIEVKSDTKLKKMEDRLAGLEAEINSLKDSESRFVKIAELKQTSEEIRGELKGISDSMRQTIGAVQQYMQTTETSNPEAMEERFSALEKRLTEVSDGIDSLSSLPEAIAALREDMQKSAVSPALADRDNSEIRSLSERLPSVESAIRGLSEELTVLKDAMALIREELEANASRMSMLSPDESAPPSAPSIEAARPGNGRRPRVLSAEARSKYTDVVGLWSQGYNSGTIADITGLDVQEIELMLAGEGLSPNV